MQYKRENIKNNMELLNLHGRKFDWDNEELDKNQNFKQFQQNLVHPDNIAEILGV